MKIDETVASLGELVISASREEWIKFWNGKEFHIVVDKFQFEIIKSRKRTDIIWLWNEDSLASIACNETLDSGTDFLIKAASSNTSVVLRLSY